MDSLQTQDIDAYIEKRAAFPVAELEKHAGNWIAFSPDGNSILGSGLTLSALQKGLQ